MTTDELIDGILQREGLGVTLAIDTSNKNAGAVNAVT